MTAARTSANRSDDSSCDRPPPRLPTAERTASTMTTSATSLTSDAGTQRRHARGAAVDEELRRALDEVLDRPGPRTHGQMRLDLDRRLQVDVTGVAGEDLGGDVTGRRARQPGDDRTDVLRSAGVELPFLGGRVAGERAGGHPGPGPRSDRVDGDTDA